MERRTFANTEEALEFVTKELLWGNAAGTCKDMQRAVKFAQAGMRCVAFGSITKEPREGNPGDNFHYDEATGDSVNSLGLPNRGFEGYLVELPGIKKAVNAHGSELWVSVSAGNAYSAYEYETMAAWLAKADAADVIEANKSCPNVVVDGKPKPNVCYDLPMFTEGVHAFSCAVRPKKAAVKLAPITEPAILAGLVEACVKYDVDYIIAANTAGNCYLEKSPGVPAITMVRGGLAGKGLRPFVKGMIQIIKPMLKGTKTKLIATAGVECGKDAYEFLELGADGFQFNTALTRRNYNPDFARSLIFGESDEQRGLLELLVKRGLPA